MPTQENDIRLTIWLIVILSSLVILCFLLFVFIYQRRQKNLILKRRQMEIEFENQLLQTQIEIQEQTLANISQELHDNVGQSITLAKLNLNTLPTIADEKTNIQIANTKTLLSNTLTNIRDLAKSMLGEKIAEIGLEAAIRNEIKLLQQTGKYTIEIQSEGEPYLLNQQKEIVAFRILQEAVHNIIKHANASSILFNFNYNPNFLDIVIADNGKGFDANLLNANNTGVGLKNMYNRAALINAKINVQSIPFQGTSLTLNINRN